MKNKGFTLVEVLAVVVLLGLLAGLVIIKVLPSINESKYSVGYASTTNLVDALEDYYFQIKMNGNFTGCSFDFSENNNSCNGFVFSGKKPTGGSLIVDSDGNINGTVYFDKNSYQVVNNKLITTDIAQVIDVGTEYVFDYTGSEQRFIVPADGIYKLEVWGAQGGNNQYTSSYEVVTGGYGGYSKGSIFLSKGTVLSINVGGKGGDSIIISAGAAGGYNGGGSGGSPGSSSANYSGGAGSGGGGATHIATTSGLLSTLSDNKDSVLIVAGGGGGATLFGIPGSGGGFQGVSSGSKSGNGGTVGGHSTGGTQTTGFAFGQGQDGRSAIQSCSVDGCEGSGGSGGGWYGGTAYVKYGSYTNDSGAGGSGYIGNKNLFNKSMYCYGCTATLGYSIKTVNTESFSESPVSGYAKVGNGYAKITFEHLGYDDSRSHNHVYYSYGTKFENMSASNTWQSSQAQFLEDHIYLPTSGFYVVYTDTIDLSLYNTVILKRTNSATGRDGFDQYPSEVNHEGDIVGVTWQNVDTNTYIADISSITRKDLHFFDSAYEGTGSGNIYYLSFSTRTVDQIKEDLSFID